MHELVSNEVLASYNVLSAESVVNILCWFIVFHVQPAEDSLICDAHASFF